MRQTPARLDALKYAAGELDQPPTDAVARPLQRARLIVWRGWVTGLPASMRVDPEQVPVGRGWHLTEEGHRVLRDWAGA
jgi:hypothetical protein